MKQDKIKKNKIVTLDYKVTDADGNIIDDGHIPFEYLHGNYQRIFPQIEKALDGLTVGDKLVLQLEKNAFGEFDDDLVLVEDASLLPKDIKLGSIFTLSGEELQLSSNINSSSIEADLVFKEVYEDFGKPMIYRVTDIAEGKVVLDGNHPLASTELCFDIKVANIRTATSEELNKFHINSKDTKVKKKNRKG